MCMDLASCLTTKFTYEAACSQRLLEASKCSVLTVDAVSLYSESYSRRNKESSRQRQLDYTGRTTGWQLDRSSAG